MDNCKEFIFTNEDTTLVGPLQENLLRHPDIVYAGYIQKHPLEHDIILKVVSKGEDPEVILVEIIKNIINKLRELKNLF
jgi:DNA-directed RNA polymerase subunit L